MGFQSLALRFSGESWLILIRSFLGSFVFWYTSSSDLRWAEISMIDLRKMELFFCSSIFDTKECRNRSENIINRKIIQFYIEAVSPKKIRSEKKYIVSRSKKSLRKKFQRPMLMRPKPLQTGPRTSIFVNVFVVPWIPQGSRAQNVLKISEMERA